MLLTSVAPLAAEFPWNEPVLPVPLVVTFQPSIVAFTPPDADHVPVDAAVAESVIANRERNIRVFMEFLQGLWF